MSRVQSYSIRLGLVLAFAALSQAAHAQGAGAGPVAQQCAAEIKEYCADKTHQAGAVRNCLAAQKSKLSADCRKALETTGGPGRGSGAPQGAGTAPNK